MNKIRIGFPLINSAGWTGGFNYLYNLLSALSEHQANRIKPILFCGLDADEDDVAKFAQLENIEIVRSSAFNIARNKVSLRLAVLTGVDGLVLKALRTEAVDVVFENAIFFGWRMPIPAIAWFPDFQHRRLRDYFSHIAFWRREIGFRVQIASKRLVMLSSEDARTDCESFYPNSIDRTAVVRFASPIDAQLMLGNTAEVLSEYAISQPFLYLPNQFWKHKNHTIVIEALGLLKKQGCEVLVISTGNPRNFLHPDVYSKLELKVLELGLETNMRFLGMVPRSHVISLMRTCCALINPSFFEGWSSTVEEGRAFGTPMLLADIAVHREQMGSNADYFSPTDHVALAQLMRQFTDAARDVLEPRSVQAGATQNVTQFAQDFVKTVDWTIRNSQS